uniref:Reverse transcriptase Ty1/copia-type domain-containing protein n=1 Tax=Trichuris muris TaxID=70415 RepID=A0A5S6QMP8_TRIMR
MDVLVEQERSKRHHAPSRAIFNSDFVVYQANTLETNDPIRYADAMRRPEASEWLAAIDEELVAHHRNHSWKICDLRKGKNAVKRRWVFRTKCKADGTVEKQTFAPTLSYSSLRLLLALAVQNDFDVNQMDVVTTFLNPSLKEEIYMELPEGVEGQKPVYCRLNKSIYGLKQASRAWLQNEPRIYHWRRNEKTLIVGICVDDLIILSNDKQTSKDLKAALQKQFEMKDLGEAHWCLGMRIVCDKEHKRLSIDQERHIDQMLETFGMTDCKVAKTPLDSNQVLSKDMAPKTEDERTEMQKVPYREAVGCLIYLSQEQPYFGALRSNVRWHFQRQKRNT